MDQRVTIENKQDFLPVLRGIYEKGELASVLYEDAGVTRASGHITSISGDGADLSFSLDNGLTIKLARLYAVNGLFSGDYSEC